LVLQDGSRVKILVLVHYDGALVETVDAIVHVESFVVEVFFFLLYTFHFKVIFGLILRLVFAKL
jgi:hypothetical protein